jgi:uncharacterized RDD family membrane protein YckC
MAKKRFRNIKQGKLSTEDTVEQTGKRKLHKRLKRDYASKGDKMKAFLTDAFMLLMPIMYIVVYLVIGSLQAFAEQRALGWGYILIPLVIIQTAFMFQTGQTPGYRAYHLTLIDENTGGKPSLFIIFFRNAAALLSLFTFFGWIMMFFRKDGKTLHDLLSNTAVIKTPAVQ